MAKNLELAPSQANQFRLIVCPNLALEHGRIDRYVPEGSTVAEHLRSIGWQPEGLHARVFIDGEFVKHAQWEYAVPKAGQSCVVRVIPMGGGQDGKQALRIVGMIGIVVAAALTAGAASAFAPFATAVGFGTSAGWAAAVAAAISISGSLRVNRMLPARPL